MVEQIEFSSNYPVEEVWVHAAMAEEDQKLGEKEWRETIRASCPEYGTKAAQ